MDQVPAEKEYPTRPGGGFQTETVYRHPGVNLNSGVILTEQLNDAVDKFYNIDGLEMPEQRVEDGFKPKARMDGEYLGKPMTVELMRQPMYEEWLLKVSSKNGLPKSDLDDLADMMFAEIAKPKSERNSDRHQLRCQY